jgi:deoxyadenosine/deoxycytidine kinase
MSNRSGYFFACHEGMYRDTKQCMDGSDSFISIMGTMGSGKTTAAQTLAHALGMRVIEENFADNSFLPLFYRDMKRWAFHSQVFFLTEKLNQLLSLGNKKGIIGDTPVYQDVYSYALAQHELGNLDDPQWRLYEKIFRTVEPFLPKPNLIVYLDASVETIMERIAKRSRGFEVGISRDYVLLLDNLNRAWLERDTSIPVVRIDTDVLNIVASPKDREKLTENVEIALDRLHTE